LVAECQSGAAVILINSDDEQSPKRHKTLPVHAGASEPANANTLLRNAPLARQARRPDDRTTTRNVKEEESDEALARRLQEEDNEALARSLQKEEQKQLTSKKSEQEHPVFKADGLGFWLLHTEGIKVSS